MFKYIPEELRCDVRSVAGIYLPYLPPIPPKLAPPLTPIRVPVGIYHNRAAPESFKNKKFRHRVGRVVFLSSKASEGEQMPHLSGEFGELAAKKEVIFHHRYDTAAKRREAHAEILSKQEKQAASHVAAVKRYLLDRRLWEIETVTMLFNEQRHSVIFPVPDAKVQELLEGWAPTYFCGGCAILQDFPEYDLAESEACLDAESEGRQTPSKTHIKVSASKPPKESP